MRYVFGRTGKVALGSRLRLMSAQLADDAGKIYELYGVKGFSPKWFPVFFLLSKDGEKTITEIADEIGHSQPSVTKIIKEMVKAGLVENRKSKDKRKNKVALTPKATDLEKRINIQCGDIDVAMDQIISEATHDLWKALEEWEFLLEQKSMFKRVEEQKKIRESKNVQIVEYEPKHRAVFKSLNEEWISTYFEIEEADRKTLDNPEEYILDKGGKIVVALYNKKAVGVCALIRRDDPEHDFEMAKMAVLPKMQGKNIGWLLGQAIINKARELGASKIYLESNTLLKPAINLYYKLGFQKIAGAPSPYKRVNIYMELDLNHKNESI